MIQLGINGFGRIGRVILRACLQKSDLEITAINDPAIDVQYICYLIKFDSTHGKFNGCVTYKKDEIFVNDRRIKIFHEKLPANIPWQTAGVHYVIEASGMFTTLEKASGHLTNETVRKVIITAPSVDVPMLILGVNDHTLVSGQKVISCASSTLYCLAPIMKILEESFGLIEGFVTSIHAMTPSLKPLDGLCLRGKHWRDHRSIHQNIIPAMTGACKALSKIIPQVKDKLCGLAFRVPIVNVSVLDLTIRVSRNTTLQEIILNVEKASKAELKSIIRISQENAVSSDFIGETHSCILDADSSLQLKPNFFKLVCWYENEYSYAYRVIDTITFSENKSSFISTTLNPVNKQDSTQQTECGQKEILGSTSHETGLKYKTEPRQLLLKKPLSSHFSSNMQPLISIKDSKKRNEFFKIWNDEKETSKAGVRQNRNCLFHSCIAITPRNLEQMSAVKAQDRLETLKKEFSKMVNVTENLLKKSYIGNFSIKSEDKAIKDTSGNNRIGESIGNSYEELSHSNRMFGDCKSDVSSINDKSSGKESNYKKFDTITQYNLKENFKCDIKIGENTKSEQNKPELESNLTSNADKSLNNLGTCKYNKNSLKVNFLCSKANEAINAEEKHVLIDRNKENVCREITKKEGKGKDKEEAFGKNNDAIKESFIRVNNSVQISKKLINQLNSTFSCINKIENKLSIKQDLNETKDGDKCRSTNPIGKEINLNSTSIDTNGKCKLNCENTDLHSLAADDEHLNKPLSKADSICPERYSLISDHTSKCGSPGNTSLTMSNVDTYRHKEDIYDKLDSISGTDSNNSFQIHEKKSQVIELSDLTTSLEDIGRLDKICKIIEISDELSNKLFSPLDNNDEIQTREKKWSFKDLCEKIKLDDFCDNVFGKC